MKRLHIFTALAAPFALACAPLAGAAEQHAPSAGGGLMQILLGLVAVLALMAGAAWLLKRFGVSGPAGGNVVKIVGGVSVGNRERVMVVEVADQWIVVGVAQGRVNALSTLPRQELPASTSTGPVAGNFAAWLKQTIDKRNGNQ
jgi:flagellar protein FliO/FliZ